MVKGQKYHILYKTICKVTGNFYIGVHSTYYLEDEYLGSGTRLSHSIAKHGRENHIREILESFETREELMKKEREVVNDSVLRDPMCMNLKPGGDGGFSNKAHGLKCSIAGNKKLNEKLKDDEFRKMFSKKCSTRNTRLHALGKLKTPDWNGKKHKEETKKKIGQRNSISQMGSRNSQFGTVWIKKDNESKKIKKIDLNLYLLNGWERGRK